MLSENQGGTFYHLSFFRGAFFGSKIVLERSKKKSGGLAPYVWKFRGAYFYPLSWSERGPLNSQRFLLQIFSLKDELCKRKDKYDKHQKCNSWKTWIVDSSSWMYFHFLLSTFSLSTMNKDWTNPWHLQLTPNYVKVNFTFHEEGEYQSDEEGKRRRVAFFIQGGLSPPEFSRAFLTRKLMPPWKK